MDIQEEKKVEVRKEVAGVHLTIHCQVEIRTIKLVLGRHLTSVPSCKSHIRFYDFHFKYVHLEQRPVSKLENEMLKEREKEYSILRHKSK